MFHGQRLNLGAQLSFHTLLMLVGLATNVTLAQDRHDDSEAASNGRANHGIAACLHAARQGVANGLLERCAHGSSAGIARGDFNADGFADLAIGVLGESVGSKLSAGAVNVIYGSANGLVTSGAGIPSAQIWHQDSVGIVGVAEEGDFFGAALASGDFNGDGFSDLAIGVPGEEVEAGGATKTNEGAVAVLFGSAGGLAEYGNTFVDLATFGLARESYANFGASLAWGDFNGDGIGDLIAAAPRSDLTPFGLTVDSAGFLIVIRGSASGLTAVNRQIVHQDAGTVTAQNFGDQATAGDSFGLRLSAGDFNSDGYTDLVVGVPYDEPSGSAIDAPGMVQVINGSSQGLNRTAVTILRQGVAGVADGMEKGDNFGGALATGDFNGDSYTDLAVGVPHEGGYRSILTPPVQGIRAHGIVQIFRGSPAGITTNGQQVLYQGKDSSATALAGSIGGLPNDDDYFGYSLAAGRFNDDRFADLAIGVPGEADGGTVAAGAVHVVYGSSSGLASDTSPRFQVFNRSSEGITGYGYSQTQFGISLSAWNFGRDQTVFDPPPFNFPRQVRTADLAVGVPRADLSGNGTLSYAGAVQILYGRVSGLSSSDSQKFTQDTAGVPGVAEAYDHFGEAMY